MRDPDRGDHCLTLLLQNDLVVAGEILNRTVAFRQLDGNVRRPQPDGPGIFLKMDVQVRDIRLNHDQARLFGRSAGHPLDDANHVFGIELDLHVQFAGLQLNAIADVLSLRQCLLDRCFSRLRVLKLTGCQQEVQTEATQQQGRKQNILFHGKWPCLDLVDSAGVTHEVWFN